jgi:GMP synthase-like glutamine amidotransferase
MTDRWAVLQHVAWEGPGLIASVARSRGLAVDVHRLDLNPVMPQSQELRGLIVMGGPMGAYETEKYAYLSAECHLIAEMVTLGRPVLGVCLGAQLLAKSLGARVFPGPSPEIGFGFVRSTPSASNDPVFALCDQEFPVFHWHGDTFTLPPGATLLSDSTAYAHQAFCVGRHAYALQFHLEADDKIWSAWEAQLPADVSVSSAQREAIRKTGLQVFNRFFDVATSIAR